MQREIVLMQERRDQELAASAYELMDAMELGAACFALYVPGRMRMRRSWMRICWQTSRPRMVVRHKLEFLREGTREEELRVWASKKIVQLTEAGDRKKAKRIRTYLEAMGGEVSAPTDRWRRR